MSKESNKAYRLVITGLFIALITVQTIVPFLGYIPWGAANITIVHLTVIIAAVMLGPKVGAIIGGIWGGLSFVRAVIAPASPFSALVFTNPIISVLPRILVGLLIGYIFLILQKTMLKNYLALIICGALGAIINTVLVLGLIYIIYQSPEAATALGTSDISNIGPILLAIATANGIPEAIFSAIITPIIGMPLLALVNKKANA